MRFHHLGIVAQTAEIGKRHLNNLLGVLDWALPIADPFQQVEVLFAVDSSGICFELIASLGERSPVLSYLQSPQKNLESCFL